MGHYSDSPKPENSGRMGRRLGSVNEPAPENFSPILMNDPTLQAPPQKIMEAHTSPSAPNKKALTASDIQNDAKGKSPEEPKDKYSIYLPQKLSMALRMAYTVSRKNKYSHVVETALTDMLYNRFQCNNPACLVRFSMSETGITPMCCPHCGEKNLTSLRIDILE